MHIKTFIFSLFSSPNNNFDVSIDLLNPQNAKTPKMHLNFEFPAKTRVNIVRNVTLLSSLDSWHQDLEFGPRMDVFGPLEPEIWLFDISLLFLVL